MHFSDHSNTVEYKNELNCNYGAEARTSRLWWSFSSPSAVAQASIFILATYFIASNAHSYVWKQHIRLGCGGLCRCGYGIFFIIIPHVISLLYSVM